MKPADLHNLAHNLRRWESCIKFPEDRFFHEDMRDAARALDEAAGSVTSHERTGDDR